jgi:hypothetical protein
MSTRIVSIDPDPRREVDAICDEVIREGLETNDLSVFQDLVPGDIVFMDGSHRCFMNSDVTVFFIDVLPLLKPGVIVHIHDIMLPWDYPESFKHWYWNEQYVLAVYLMNSMDRVEPLLPVYWMSQEPSLAAMLAIPFTDLGDTRLNAAWTVGGSLWFTQRS